MGCSGSKAEDMPLVVRCRQRRDLIRAAANHRYALAAAHISYFRSLIDVGDAFRRFVDEELIFSARSSSSFSSSSIILPRCSTHKHDNAGEGGESDESHVHLSDSSSEDVDSDVDCPHHHHHHHHHRHRPHQRHKHHSRKENKGSDGEASHSHSEGENSPNYTHGGFNGYGDRVTETSSHHPREANLHGYETGFGDAYNTNTSFDPYPHPFHYPPSTSYTEPFIDKWGPAAAQPPWVFSSNTNMFYMTKVPPSVHTVVHEPLPEPDSYWNPATSFMNHGYGGNHGYDASMGIRNSERGRKGEEVPPPPSPKASGWDFFNPFDGLENGYFDYYSGRRNFSTSSSSSSETAELRITEGIPDLEEETLKLNGHKMKDDDNDTEDSSKSTLQQRGEDNFRNEPTHEIEGRPEPPLESECEKTPVPLQHKRDKNEKPFVPPPSLYNKGSEKSVKPPITLPEDEGPSSIKMEGSITVHENVALGNVGEGDAKRKGVNFEVEEVSKHGGGSPEMSSVAVLLPRGTRDLREVAAEIRNEFKTAAGYGKEVAAMLEVGKMPHQPSLLKVIRSRILYPLSSSLSVSSHDPPSLQSSSLASKTMKLAKSYIDDVGKDVDAKACNLSSTLDKLYAWEKKLYKEVKEEEELRVMYEKRCKRLRTLDDEGADPIKINATRASIRRLLTKLDVSVKAIDSISIQIHKLMDEELHPQVAELIHGFTRMWKAMLKCHQKQFEAVMESKIRRLRAKTAPDPGPDPIPRASAALERELTAWRARFDDWIASQKLYAESLNGWLLRCLRYEPEPTPGGPAPYSPGRLGAPPVFVICNDWHRAVQAASEAPVANAVSTFAASLRQPWRDEEGRREKRVGGTEGLPVAVRPDRGGGGGVDIGEKVAARGGGLVPIFKALESFTRDAVNAHEGVRVDRRRPGS